MHIGILGTGFGKYHGELYKKIDPAIQLTFYGRDEEKLKKIHIELNCDYTMDIDDFFKNRCFDFIDICLPSHLHAEFALKALEMNNSVFLETPAVTTIEDGIKIMEAAQKNRKKVFVNMFLRYDPYYQMIHDLVQSNKYGMLKHLTVFRRTPPLWGNLGNDTIALALMIHDFDFVTWLSKDLRIVSCNVATNSNNSGAVVDCLLSDDTLKIHVQGNSMQPVGSPFSVGYEATFENASVTYFEKSFHDAVQTECYIYSDGRKEKVSFEIDEHCKAMLEAVIKDFCNDKANRLSLENALPGLSIAYELAHAPGCDNRFGPESVIRL